MTSHLGPLLESEEAVWAAYDQRQGSSQLPFRIDGTRADQAFTGDLIRLAIAVEVG